MPDFHGMYNRGQAYSVSAKTCMAILIAVIALGHPA
jgi:hypothetical protein